MPHAIIILKNRDLSKRIADANVELLEAHEAIEAMPEGPARDAAEALMDTLVSDTEAFYDVYDQGVKDVYLAAGL